MPVPSEAKGNITHLAKQRNRLQQFALTEPASTIESRTALVLDFLLDFVHDQLRPKLSGTDLAHLDEQMEIARRGLSQIQALVKARMDRIQPALDGVAQWTLRCVTCGRWAVVADGRRPACRFCGASWDSERAAEVYAADFLGLTRYEAVTGFSGDPPSAAPTASWTPSSVTCTPQPTVSSQSTSASRAVRCSRHSTTAAHAVTRLCRMTEVCWSVKRASHTRLIATDRASRA